MEKEVLEWLCEEDNPSVRYFTLKNLLGKGEQDAEVEEARRQIMLRGVVPKILSKSNEDGHYVDEKVIRKYGKAIACMHASPILVLCQSIREPSGNSSFLQNLAPTARTVGCARPTNTC